MPQKSKRKHKMRHVTRQVTGAPWQILPEKLEQVCEVLNLRSAGMEWAEGEIRARLAANGVLVSDLEDRRGETPAYSISPGGIAVIPLEGMLGPKMNLFMLYSGGTSTQQFAQAVRQAADDPKVSVGVIEVDSGGGYAMGNEEAVLAIREARQKKRFVTIAVGDMASAAYYVGVAAGQGNVFASPSSWAGSIGTIYVHAEYSKQDTDQGVRFTVVRGGENKWSFNDYEPLTDRGKGHIQEEVDQANRQFVESVATSRGITVEKVLAEFGQGKYFIAEEAAKLGLIDGVKTLEEVIAELSAGPRGSVKRSAQNRVSEEVTMDTRIMAALRDRELIDANADKKAAEAVLNTWYKAQDRKVPESTEQVLEDLKLPEPTTYTQAQMDAAVETARQEATAGTVELTVEKTAGPFSQEQLDAAVDEAEKRMAAKATKVERERASAILAKIELAQLKNGMATARGLIDEGLSMARATDRLLTLKCEQAAPVGETAGTDLATKKKDPDDKFRKEFAEGGGEAKLDLTEEEYIASRRKDEGLD